MAVEYLLGQREAVALPEDPADLAVLGVERRVRGIRRRRRRELPPAAGDRSADLAVGSVESELRRQLGKRNRQADQPALTLRSAHGAQTGQLPSSLLLSVAQIPTVPRSRWRIEGKRRRGDVRRTINTKNPPGTMRLKSEMLRSRSSGRQCGTLRSCLVTLCSDPHLATCLRTSMICTNKINSDICSLAVPMSFLRVGTSCQIVISAKLLYQRSSSSPSQSLPLG